MTYYQSVLLSRIEREKTGKDYQCSETDRKLLKELFDDINKYACTDFHYLSELDAFTIKGIGSIAINYIEMFESETIRKILMEQVVADKVRDCDKLVLQWYLHFRESGEYISKPGMPSPAHIHVGYDNAFITLKPKRLKNALLNLAYNPRDFHYLPLTMKMLASWKLPELLDLLVSYLDDERIKPENVGLQGDVDNVYPSLSTIRLETKFTAIHGLRYYPSEYTKYLVKKYINDSNSDICELAKRTLKIIEKKL